MLVGFASYGLQMASTSDVRPGFLYLSPTLAALFALVTLARLIGSRRLLGYRRYWPWRDGIASGTVLAGAIFWFALVPVNGLPSTGDLAALLSALLIHLVMPVLAILDAMSAGSSPVLITREAAVLPTLVLAYGLLAILASRALDTSFPYEFLDPSIAGWPFAIFAGVMVVIASYGCNYALLKARSREFRAA